MAQFIGRFHIVLLHLPIGMLVLIGCLELVSLHPRWRQATAANGFILCLTAPTAVLTAVCGWLLASTGGYDERLLFLHRWSGVAVAVAACVLLLLHRRSWARAFRIGVGVTTVLTIVTGHVGGSLTHGGDFLTRYAPGWICGQAGGGRQPKGNESGFAVVAPVLAEYCVACHGSEKSKGGLRVDSLEHSLVGGDSGPAVVAGSVEGSLLLQRILLPLEDDDHMPPEGKPQPTSAEIELIRNWISSRTLE